MSGQTRQLQPEPPTDCQLCPRLVAFRKQWRIAEPDWHNSPVPTFGDRDARLLIVGLAPGLRGANRTGRPFTGDHAGLLLYQTLIRTGFATGLYEARPDDGLTLRDVAISNAVRCVPPENKPSSAEIWTCRTYLSGLIAAMPNLAAILALGKIAHDSVIAALGMTPARHRFGHGAEHSEPDKTTVFDSYHCSRLNTNTGRLTEAMFASVVAHIADRLEMRALAAAGGDASRDPS